MDKGLLAMYKVGASVSCDWTPGVPLGNKQDKVSSSSNKCPNDLKILCGGKSLERQRAALCIYTGHINYNISAAKL